MKARQSVTLLPVAKIRPHPSNVRTDLGDVTELAASIREHGILQPLTVTEDYAGDFDGYLLLAGHRRFAAAQLAQLTTVPCVIRHDVEDEAEQLVLMLVENCQRQDLSTVERAEAYGSLRKRGLSLTDIARRTGTHASTVSYYLSLLDLDAESLEGIRRGAVRVGDARQAVVAVRQQQRVQRGTPQRGRPVVAEPHHFGRRHPLAEAAVALCSHSTRPKVGQLACGQCWERVIRNDVLGVDQPASQPASRLMTRPQSSEPSTAIAP
jgi:ParB family chromosome partitioning protein